MKKLIFSFLFLAISQTALADSVSWKMGPVQGLLETTTELDLTGARVLAYCHYCNVGTCAGGPTVETVLPTKLQRVASHQYQLSVGAGSHKSSFLFKTLKECGYLLEVQGVDVGSHKKVPGSFLLAVSSKRAANPIYMDEQINEALTEKMSSEPLKLEIAKIVLGSEIQTRDAIPYFSGKP